MVFLSRFAVLYLPSGKREVPQPGLPKEEQTRSADKMPEEELNPRSTIKQWLRRRDSNWAFTDKGPRQKVL